MVDHKRESTTDLLIQFLVLQPDFERALEGMHTTGKFLSYCDHVGASARLINQFKVDQAFDEVTSMVRDRNIKTLWQELDQPPDPMPLCRLLAELMLSPSEYAVLHWWLSDRKAQLRAIATQTPYETTQPPMPVLRGDQGLGKSTLVKALLSPLGQFWQPLSFDQYIDPRFTDDLSANLVIFLDELAGNKLHEIRAFKRIIYADKLRHRRLYENRKTSPDVNAMPIGCSNEPTAELLYDLSGCRRYFDIIIKENIYSLAQNFDWLTLWKSIDPDYFPDQLTRDVITTDQNKQQPESTFDQWYDDEGKVLLLSNDRDQRRVAVIYGLYKVYCRVSTSGVYLGRNAFSRRLVRSGYKKKRDNRGWYFEK